MRVLITGISGFVGTHLAEYFLRKEEAVFGFDMALPLNRNIVSYAGDIRDPAAVRRALVQAEPQVVFHLAGVLKSDHPEVFHQVNVLGTKVLFESICDLGIAPTVLLSSSSAVYGRGYRVQPISEDFKLHPETPYAMSKVQAEAIALSSNIPVMIVRTFNLLGPGQPPILACSSFARQIALAEATGPAGTIETGNLDARRDYSDVRDVARAFALLARQGRPGSVYNICSGQAVTTRECLDILVQMARVPMQVKVDPDRMQTTDIPIQVGSADRLYRLTGWQPEISLRQSLADLLAYWRDEVI